jgi:outer membrane protein assembly factor BamD
MAKGPELSVIIPHLLPHLTRIEACLMIRLPGVARILLVFALVLGLGGCKTVGGWFGRDKEAKTEALPLEQLYAQAKDDMLDGNYNKAQKYYTRLIARFPYGPYSEQSQLELAYVNFKLGKPEDATSSIDRFIRTYPRHQHIDYAYYLKAVINFDSNSGWLESLSRQDAAERDLDAPIHSLSDFNEVVRRYPNSRYAPDSRQRMVYLRNLLARYELNTGLYYWERHAYLASANRGKYVLENYPGSEFDGDAVALMASSYTALGEKTLADDARRVLEKNYPQHAYLQGKWPKKKSLLRQLNPFAGEVKKPE